MRYKNTKIPRLYSKTTILRPRISYIQIYRKIHYNPFDAKFTTPKPLSLTIFFENPSVYTKGWKLKKTFVHLHLKLKTIDMKTFLYNIARWIGYTISIEDTINFEPWEVKKYTHIVIYKYQGRWKSDNSIRLRRVWAFKIR